MRRTDGHPKTLRKFSHMVKIEGGNRNTFKLIDNFHRGRNYQRESELERGMGRNFTRAVHPEGRDSTFDLYILPNNHLQLQ